LSSKSLSAESPALLARRRKIDDATPDRRRCHRAASRFGASAADGCTSTVVGKPPFIPALPGLRGPARIRAARRQLFTDRLHFHYRRLTSRTNRVPSCATLARIKEQAARCAICLRILRSTPTSGSCAGGPMLLR